MIILFDCTEKTYKEAILSLSPKEWEFIVTRNCNELREYDVISKKISPKSKKNIAVLFSGRESIISELGNEYPDMIIGISTNKRSSFYVENPNTFIRGLYLLDIIEDKEK